MPRRSDNKHVRFALKNNEVIELETAQSTGRSAKKNPDQKNNLFFGNHAQNRDEVNNLKEKMYYTLLNVNDIDKFNQSVQIFKDELPEKEIEKILARQKIIERKDKLLFGSLFVGPPQLQKSLRGSSSGSNSGSSSGSNSGSSSGSNSGSSSGSSSGSNSGSSSSGSNSGSISIIGISLVALTVATLFFTSFSSGKRTRIPSKAHKYTKDAYEDYRKHKTPKRPSSRGFVSFFARRIQQQKHTLPWLHRECQKHERDMGVNHRSKKRLHHRSLRTNKPFI